MSAPTDGGYKLVPNWPTLPPGEFFGLKTPPPPPAEREAQAAARRATGTGGNTPRPAGQGPTNQPGISGLAIDQQDRIYVFNRGAKPVMVFNTDGKLVASGGDQELNGKKLDPNWQHSGAVDWDGNVYMIERDAHRIVKLSPKMDKVLLQLGTTMEKGNDATHFDLAVRHRRSEERQHHRHRRLRQQPRRDVRQDRQVHQAGGEGRRRARPTRATVPANGCCRTSSPSMRRRTSTSSTARAIACRCIDKNLNYLREIKVDGWNPWDIAHFPQGR